jgi:hypothetical protein
MRPRSIGWIACQQSYAIGWDSWRETWGYEQTSTNKKHLKKHQTKLNK